MQPKQKMTGHFSSLLNFHCLVSKIGSLWLCSASQFEVHIDDRISRKLRVKKWLESTSGAQMFVPVGEGYVYQNGMIQTEKKVLPVLPEAQNTHIRKKGFPGK